MKDKADIRFLKEPLEKISDDELGQVSFLMAIRERTTLDEQVFKRMPHLKLVLQTGGHAYHIDTAAAKRQGIAIALGRKVKAPLLSVPELTFAFVLGLMHLIPQAMATMRTGIWTTLTGRTLARRRLGILGLGRHGTRVAEIASTAFGMEVVGWDRTGNGSEKKEGYKRMPLDELLTTSDVVSIHLRLSTESTGLMNRQRLEMMKSGSVLINTSRGAIVDETALIDVLRHGPLAGAGLDVFIHEPLPPDSPLRTLDNVMLTPHIGWTVEEVFEEFAWIACTQLKEYLEGSLATTELLA
jgi:phosphoglycerate dehydrogenase-like enzyme